MIKKIKLRGEALQIKCDILIRSCFKSECSKAELSVVTVLIKYSTGNCINLTSVIADQARQSAGVSATNWTTCLFRLEKKGIISRAGKTISFHPIFNNIQDCESIMLNFESEAPENKSQDPEIK